MPGLILELHTLTHTLTLFEKLQEAGTSIYCIWLHINICIFIYYLCIILFQTQLKFNDSENNVCEYSEVWMDCVDLMSCSVSTASTENSTATNEKQHLCVVHVSGEEAWTMRIFVGWPEKRLFASLQGQLNQSRTMLCKVNQTTHILFVRLYTAAPLNVLS